MTSTVDSAFIESLKALNDEKAIELLSKLSADWSQRYEFSELDCDQKRALSESLCYLMENTASSDVCRCHCVEIVRLLSREKINIDRLIDERLINDLVSFAGFSSQPDNLARDPDSDTSSALSLEAQKALCNLMFQSEKARRLCLGTACLQGLSQRLLENPELGIYHDYHRRFYDLRLLFLLTALCPDIRGKCRDPPLDNLNSLTNILNALIQKGQFGANEKMEAAESTVSKAKVIWSDKEINLICETLKVIFNLVLPYKMSQVDENELGRLDRLADIMLGGLLLSNTEETAKEELQSNIVNLLTALPSPCYLRLTPRVETAVASSGVALPVPVYDGRNMEAVQVLLDFLDARLDKPAREQLESLSPILTLLIDMARKHRHLRKYMRFKVLPPLTDVMHRPEEGATLRNKLVRLMTAVTTEIKDLAADFLFELCHRSIDRLIKYTGFGNAAGMLSMHGLMGAAISGRPDVSGNASDEGENSDTEEYLRVRDQINPVIGCYEPTHPDPMAGMSEEQKEYEAMKLVEQIDKMMKQGVVVPGRLGDDGRVHPVEHVLQLAEEAERSGVTHGRRRSSSDDEVDD